MLSLIISNHRIKIPEQTYLQMFEAPATYLFNFNQYSFYGQAQQSMQEQK